MRVERSTSIAIEFLQPALLLMAFTLTVGCGGPTSPSAASIAGSWIGTWQETGLQEPYEMSLVQSSQNVTGTYVVKKTGGFVDFSGIIAGSVSGGQFAGTMTLSGCVGTVAAVSGATGGSSMVWTSSGFVGAGGHECPSSNEVTPRFSLTVKK